MKQFSTHYTKRLTRTLFVLLSLALLSTSCKDDEEENDPCLTSDLAITASGSGTDYELAATGGSSPYQYQLDDEDYTSSNLFALTVGEHTLTVKDDNGCMASTTVTVDSTGETDVCLNTDLAISVTGSGTDYEVSASGGVSPYEYQLDDNDFTSSAEFTVAMGDHVFTVKDSQGCTVSTTVTTDACEDISVSASGNGFDVSIEITEGTAPYKCAFSTSDGTVVTDSTLSGTSGIIELDTAAALTLTVTDANGCTATTTLTAEEISTFTDSRDGQTYQTVKIGDQIWFAENYNYNTNTADSTSSWYYSDDSTTYAADYGRLYTWHVATKIAPEGWSFPGKSDFETLITTIGGTNEGKKLIVDGETGFNAVLAGGYFLGEGDDFYEINSRSFYWTSYEKPSDENKANYYSLYIAGGISNFYGKKIVALSIRFIKD